MVNNTQAEKLVGTELTKTPMLSLDPNLIGCIIW